MAQAVHQRRTGDRTAGRVSAPDGRSSAFFSLSSTDSPWSIKLTRFDGTGAGRRLHLRDQTPPVDPRDALGLSLRRAPARLPSGSPAAASTARVLDRQRLGLGQARVERCDGRVQELVKGRAGRLVHGLFQVPTIRFVVSLKPALDCHALLGCPPFLSASRRRSRRSIDRRDNGPSHRL